MRLTNAVKGTTVSFFKKPDISHYSRENILTCLTESEITQLTDGRLISKVDTETLRRFLKDAITDGDAITLKELEDRPYPNFKQDLMMYGEHKVKGTGEMSQIDIEKGGDFYESRKFLEDTCKEAGVKCKVKPFDVYQGPYAQLENSGKLWYDDKDNLFYEGPKGPKTLPTEEMVEFLQSLFPKKPKLVYKSKEKEKGLKKEHQRSTPEERKHLQLIKSALRKILANSVRKKM